MRFILTYNRVVPPPPSRRVVRRLEPTMKSLLIQVAVIAVAVIVAQKIGPRLPG